MWWRLDCALDEQSLRAAARDYVARALLAGTTTLVDHHESPNLIDGSLAILAEACEELGVRALLCYGATERNFSRQEARRGLAECRRVAASPLVRGLVGLHASFTISDETALEAGALARELGTVVHVHVAEDQADVDDARRRGYPGPLERLLALDALPEGSILAHGVRLSRDEVRRAADAGCWFVHNPRSNEGNRVGYASALAAAQRVALGTDGWDARHGGGRRGAAPPGRAEWRHGCRRTAGARARAGRGAFRRRGRAAGARLARRSGRAARRRGCHVVVGGRSWSRTAFWRRPTRKPLKPRRAPRRRACGRAWRRSETGALTRSDRVEPRHCEERSDEAMPGLEGVASFVARCAIASLRCAMTAM